MTSAPQNNTSQFAEDILHHHTELPRTAISDVLDAIVMLIGKTASWLWLAVMGVIIYSVVGRYAFGQGSVTLEEWAWHLSSGAWLMGLAYTLTADDHVRVDVIHENLSLKAQAWIELFGLLFLLAPFLVFALLEAIPYAISSYAQNESSQAPAGLANRWILKGLLAASFALLMVAGLSRLMRVTALLFGVPRPRALGPPQPPASPPKASPGPDAGPDRPSATASGPETN